MWRIPLARHGEAAPRPIDVTAPRPARHGSVHRVAARVDGRSVWFESADLPLAAATEAYGGALLVPALHAGRPLRLEGGCPVWAGNLARLADELRQSWYPESPRPLVVPTAAAHDAGNAAARRAGAEAATVLCFSGGVDAFHTLVTHGGEIDTLAYVVGYDVRLRDRRRAAAVVAMVREVAAETGHRGVVISTNLRRHPLVRAPDWVRANGGPLAAIGHLLGAEAGRLLISSNGLGFEHPDVGSRASIDPLHGSATLAVEHVAPAVTRVEKIARIAGEPLVQRHLWVCWRQKGPRSNCGRCEKCIRTMLALDSCGMLGRFAGFDHGRGLVAAIDGLAAVEEVVEAFYRDSLASGLSASTAAAVRRLLVRSGGAPAGGPAAATPAAPASPSQHVRHDRLQRTPPTAARHRLLPPAAFEHVLAPLAGRRVGYVRPEGNVGDGLIEVAMIQLFAEFGIRWRLASPGAPGGVDGLDLLAFGGGGNMGTRYPGNHALRTRALATGLPVVILPQSFTAAEDRPFAHVFVRERASLGLRPDGVLAPDLALGLATAKPALPDRGLGVFLRRDQERGGRKPLLARDPVRIIRDPFAYLAFAARHRRIVTDRLHFAVAGLHAGRDVTLVANDYHKNRSMHETWLADLGCRFAATAAEALGRRAA